MTGSKPIFVVGLAEGRAPLQSHTAPAHASTTNTSNAMTHQTTQERDHALLREVATITVKKALAALNACDPAAAVDAINDAQGYVSRFATAHQELVAVNARKAGTDNPGGVYDLPD